MADYVVTPANVLASDNAAIKRGKAGATITAGQWLYFDDLTGTYKPGDANGASPLYIYVGIAQHGASAGQPIQMAVSDPQFTPGFAIAQGDIVITSATAGGMAPDADKASGWFVTLLGVGIGGNKMNLNPLDREP